VVEIGNIRPSWPKQTLFSYFPVITVKLLWNNLYCIVKSAI